MPVSVYERRKFVRVDINLEVRINRQLRAAIKKLSLGGCLLECNKALDPLEPIQLEFSVQRETFRLTGYIIHSFVQYQYGIRFETDDEDVARLVGVIQQIQDAAIARRSTRLKVHREAFLDNEACVLTNLSEGGCSIQTPRFFNYGDIVEVRFLLKEEIYLAGQVRWRTRQGVGVEFLSPDPTQVSEIAAFISTQTAQTRAV